MEDLKDLAEGVGVGVVLGGESPVDDGDEVAAKLVGIPFDLLSLRSYSNVNETALLYQHREKMTGSTSRGTTADLSDHLDFLQEVRTCRAQIFRAMDEAYDGAIKRTASQFGYESILGLNDLKREYGTNVDIYDETFQALLHSCMFGITESGRDAWLIEAEQAFLLKRGWKYTLPPKHRQHNPSGDDADLDVATKDGGGRNKVGFVRRHMIKRKEDHVRALRGLGVKTHGEYVGHRKPRGNQEFKKKKFLNMYNGYLISPAGDIEDVEDGVPEDDAAPRDEDQKGGEVVSAIQQCVLCMRAVGEVSARRCIEIAFPAVGGTYFHSCTLHVCNVIHFSHHSCLVSFQITRRGQGC